MAGTVIGGQRAAESNKQKHGSDFYKMIGSKGGRKGKADGVIKGFAVSGKAVEAGRKGGTISRRKPNAVH